MKGIFLLLGTNLGDKLNNLQKAKDLLATLEITIQESSSIWESAPWGETDQDWFLNMVLKIETLYDPDSLLETCMKVEHLMGRQRIKKWSSRIIDVDILYYNDLHIETSSLTIPHPAIQLRRFTLEPLTEIVPNEMHPLLNISQKGLLEICPDTLECNKTDLTLGS